MPRKTNKKTRPGSSVGEELKDLFTDEIERAIERGEEKIIYLGERVREYVKRNPEGAILIALGIGALIGSGISNILGKRKQK